MRVDRRNPRLVYRDFWHWLRIGANPFWLLALIFGYWFYMVTTEEV